MVELSPEAKAQIIKQLLVLAEDTAKDAVEVVFSIAELAVKDSENKIDDMILPVLPMLKEVILKYVDKIVED